MDIRKTILKYALQNAIRYNGKANSGSIISKVIGEDPSLKTKVKDLMIDIKETVKKVNSMKIEKQIEELKKLAPELLETKKEEKKTLKELPNAKEGKVVMRFAPSPSGPAHIGHAYIGTLNSEYCRMYKGKLILRIEDTNPENIYPGAYEMLPDEINWLTKNNIAEVVIQSDRLGIYYDYAEKLIDMGKAYVCTCDPDKFREMHTAGIACPCRNLSIKEQQIRWGKMFGEYKPGEAVLRIKTDIKHKNPAMRDWPAMRINDHIHPRKGTEARVWPLMNFAVAIDDHDMGVTHSIRGKDHMDNEKRQKYIFDYFGWKMPESLFAGRINFTDLEISASKTRRKIEEGEFTGWDDIRLPFFAALRRRGYQPEAFIKYALDVGVSQTDKTISSEDYFKAINHFNKEVIEPKAHRYFFIKDPVKIRIENAPNMEFELDLHPENKKGGRKFKTNDEFYIEKEDFNSLKEGKLNRLMDCLNFLKKGKKFVFDSTDYSKFKEKGDKIIHWLPASKDVINISILMPDHKKIKGIAESSAKKIKVNDIVQFERFGFCRCDKENEFWFTHK